MKDNVICTNDEDFLYSFVNEYYFVESWHGENEEELYPPTWKVFELFIFKTFYSMFTFSRAMSLNKFNPKINVLY